MASFNLITDADFLILQQMLFLRLHFFDCTWEKHVSMTQSMLAEASN